MSSFPVNHFHELGASHQEAVIAYAKSRGAYRVYAYASTSGGKHDNYKFCGTQADEAGLLNSPYSHNVMLIYERGKWLRDPNIYL